MLPFFQYYMPQHGLSRLAGWLANSRLSWLKNRLIAYFVKRYPVNMEEAEEPNPFAYESYNAFFTRRLKASVRPIAGGLHDLVSPVDGVISQVAAIREGKLIQAKGHDFEVSALLGGEDALAHSFKDGQFITLYLAPHHYHRVHMPIDGDLAQMIYLPGKLFSVNFETADTIPNLFAVNERVISIFNTTIGKVAVILVGAMLVGSMETVWAGALPPKRNAIPLFFNYPEPFRLKRGEEMGRFKLGSTVILLFQKNAVTFNQGILPNQELKFGECLGIIHPQF